MSKMHSGSSQCTQQIAICSQWNGTAQYLSTPAFPLACAQRQSYLTCLLLEWILINQGVTFLLHYLDNYLTMGPPNSHICQRNLSLLVEVCAVLGIPLALEKVVGPSTVLEFLGILLDTERMEARLPGNKLSWIQTTILD